MPYKDRNQYTADVTNVQDGEHIQQSVSNRPHTQLIINSDVLASSLNADRMFFVIAPSVAWNRSTLEFWWWDDIVITFLNESISVGIGGAYEHVITGGTATFGVNDEILYIKLSRTNNETYTSADIHSCHNAQTLQALIAAEDDQGERFLYFIVAMRGRGGLGTDFDYLTLWDGTILPAGTEFSDFTTLKLAGINFFYASLEAHHYLNRNSVQDRNIILSGGGALSWDGTNLTTTQDLNFHLANNPDGVLVTIQAGTFPAIGPGQSYRITMNRDDGNIFPAASVIVINMPASHGISTPSDDRLLIAYCDGESRLYLRNGDVIHPGMNVTLGGLSQGIRWVYTGSGNGNPIFDIDEEFNVNGNGNIIPASATPEFLTGGTELFVWVNGILRSEGRYRAGLEDSEDYDEPAPAGEPSSIITWTSSHIPDENDKIVIAVGLANPSISLPDFDTISVTAGDGTPIGSLPLVDGEVREDDTSDPSITLATPGDSRLEISVSDNIKDPVYGRCRHIEPLGTVFNGAIAAFEHRPRIFYGGWHQFLDVTAGTIALPLTPNWDRWIVARNWHHTWLPIFNSASHIDSEWPNYPGPIYVYVVHSFAGAHDCPFTLRISGLPPAPHHAGSYSWLGHPTSKLYIYIGSFIALGVDGSPPSSVIPFDTLGDEIIFQGGHKISSELFRTEEFSGSQPSSSTNFLVFDSNTILPMTASGVILQGKFVYDAKAHADNGGNDPVGLTFYSYRTGPSVGFSPSPINDDQDVWCVQTPYNTTEEELSRMFTFGPVTVPINDQDIGITDPTVGVVVSDYWSRFDIVLHGYVERSASPRIEYPY